jgi:hypothetical protein
MVTVHCILYSACKYAVTLDSITDVCLCIKDIGASDVVFVTYPVLICITDRVYRYIKTED